MKGDQVAYQNAAQQKVQLLAEVLNETAWMSLSPHAAWMVGDTEADILAGQAAGLSTVAVTCGIRSQAYLERFKPTYIRKDLLSTAHNVLQEIGLLRESRV